MATFQRDIYNTTAGTVGFSGAGNRVVTFTGMANAIGTLDAAGSLVSPFGAGSLLRVGDRLGVVATVDSTSQVTLAHDWAGSTASGQAYQLYTGVVSEAIMAGIYQTTGLKGTAGVPFQELVWDDGARRMRFVVESGQVRCYVGLTRPGAAAETAINLAYSIDPATGAMALGVGSIKNTSLADMAQATFKMRAVGAGTGAPIDGTPAQAKAALGLPTATTVGRLARFSDTSGSVGLSTGLYEDGSGNVSVGTAAVVGAGTLQVQRPVAGGSPATVGTTDANQFMTIGTSGSVLRVGAYLGGNTWIQPSLTNYAVNLNLSLNPNGGMVTIGTYPSSPGGLLHVNGALMPGGAPATSGSSDANLIFRTQFGGVGFDWGGYNSGIAWCQPRFVADFSTNFGMALLPNGGNLGVGVAAPSQKLHVLGNIKADGAFWSNTGGASGVIYFGTGSNVLATDAAGTLLNINSALYTQVITNVPNVGGFFDVNAGPLVFRVSSAGAGIGGINPAAALDVNGARAGRHQALVAANGANHNVTLPNAEYILVSGPTTTYSFSGFAGGVAGRIIEIIGVANFTFTCTHEDANSAPGNRIQTFGGGTTPASRYAAFIYDGSVSRWRLFRFGT